MTVPCEHANVQQLHDATYLCSDCGIKGYRTKTGRILTNDDIEALADEAEQGYDISAHDNTNQKDHN